MPTDNNRSLPIPFINVTMKNINNLTDDIYECLVDEDYEELNIKIKEINYIFRDLKKISENLLK
jgi:hypothetical protein